MTALSFYVRITILNAFALGSIVEWTRFDRPWAHAWGFWNYLLTAAALAAIWQLVKAVRWFRTLGRAVDAATAVLVGGNDG